MIQLKRAIEENFLKNNPLILKLLGFWLALSCYLSALPLGINKILTHSKLSKNEVSIYIKEVGEHGKVIASLNENRLQTPASVIKVFTTYASVLHLGFNYRIPTKFYITGGLKNGVVLGDLIIKGFGDPSLHTSDLENIVNALSKKGIEKIQGNIVIDRSYFDIGTKNNSGFDENRYSPYNAMPDAMMFNERVSTVCFLPKNNHFTKKTPDESYKVINQLKRVNKPCKGSYSWINAQVKDKSEVPTLYLKGKISKKCGKREVCKVITKPYHSFYYALKELLKKKGIGVGGRLRLRKVPYNASLFYTHYSKTLERIIAKTAKKSNNLYARELLLLLGAKIYHAPATLHKGEKAIKSILKKSGALVDNRLKIDNGSGLSRSAKISAKMLVKLYDNAYHKYGQRWLNTLSIAGKDGTINRRFRGTIVQNRAWMKTGTLKHTKNIGGYVKSKEGKLYIATILVKTKKGLWRASKLQNDILKWLVKYKNRNFIPSHQKIETPSLTKTDYYIQVGASSIRPTNKHLSPIKKLGFTPHIKKLKNYRIVIGGFKTKQEAQKALPKIQRLINKHAYITKM